MEREEPNPRLRYFNEEGDCLSPFKHASWRGCCLNRDRFDATLMPRFLFDAVVEAAGASELLVAIYTPHRPEVFQHSADWAAFQGVVSRPANQSMEHVLFDSSGKWAILGELDVMVLGASSDVADRIDMVLRQHGTSFRQMTVWDYPETQSSDDERFAYMRAVVSGGHSIG